MKCRNCTYSGRYFSQGGNQYICHNGHSDYDGQYINPDNGKSCPNWKKEVVITKNLGKKKY